MVNFVVPFMATPSKFCTTPTLSVASAARVIRIADFLEPVVLDDGQVFSQKCPSSIHIAGPWRPMTHIPVEATNMLGRLAGNERDLGMLLRSQCADSFADSDVRVGGPNPCRAR
jgi:hypothetical protein